MDYRHGSFIYWRLSQVDIVKVKVCSSTSWVIKSKCLAVVVAFMVKLTRS